MSWRCTRQLILYCTLCCPFPASRLLGIDAEESMGVDSAVFFRFFSCYYLAEFCCGMYGQLVALSISFS